MDRSDIPSLDDLRAFEAAARLGSVRLAADTLALTHGAVSRRIAKLSRDLGLQLFERSGRGLRLTPAGETLYLTVNRFFGELRATVQGLRAAATRDNALVLSCEPSVAMRWLIPRLGAFQAAHGEIALHLSVGGGALDFARERVDLAIRRLDFALPESWQVKRLFAEKVGPVMVPDLVADFEEGAYIGLATRTRPDAWPRWLARHAGRPRPKEIRFYDHHFLMVEAASAGLGVGLSPLVLVSDDIRRGRLKAPAGFWADGSHYGLIRPGGFELDAKVERLSAWLVQECTRSFG